MGIWDDIAGNAPEETVAREKLPADVWTIGRTATRENGEAAPKSKPGKAKDGSIFYQFNVALLCDGGEKGKLDERKHRSQFTFFSAYVHDKDERVKPSGRLTGFLNAVFSPGVGDELVAAIPAGADAELKKEAAKQRTIARWTNTCKLLQQVASEKGLTPDQYANDLPRYIVGCAVAALENSSRTILFKTKRRDYTTKDGTPQFEIEAGAIEDFTPQNAGDRKVARFDAAAVDTSF